MTSLEARLIAECQKFPPDMVELRKIIDAGADVNAKVDDENVLSGIILGYPDGANGASTAGSDGRYLPAIISLFLASGFDVRKDNGAAGASCLQNLTWASHDDYILEAAKLLLDAGADPSIDLDADEFFPQTVLSWVGTKASGEIVGNGDYESSNRFCVLYDIMDASIKGLDYHSIQNCYCCIGKRIEGIYVCSRHENELTLPPAVRGVGYFPAAPVIFDCEGLQLCLHNKYKNLYVDALAAREYEYRTAVDDDILKSCIGRTITAIVFEPQDTDGQVSDCHKRKSDDIIIKLENGDRISVRYDIEKDRCAVIQIYRTGHYPV